MKQLFKNAKYIFIFVLALSYVGCEDVENLFPTVTSAFTYTVNEETGTVTFINISEDARTYLWDFGDGATSTEINPIKSYSESGTYTVTLKALNEAGASDTSEDQITILIVIPVEPCTEDTAQSLDAVDFNLTFETDPSASIASFDAGLSTIANPDFSNTVNPSCQVGQIERIGSALFANNQIEFDAKFDFNANAGFKLKVWSPVAGTNVLVKLEDKTDDGIFTEVGATTTSASAWEELTFDFPISESGKYDKIIFFFELNTNTTETYYIDDFKLYGSNGGGTTDANNLAINGDFETGNTSGWDISPNNGTFEVTSAEAACGSFSGHLVADVDGGNGGASFPFVKQANIGIGTVTPNSQVTISFDLRGSLIGAGGVFIAEFFSEGAGGVSKSEILSGGALFPTDTWTRYSYTVTTGNDVSSGVTLLLKTECGPIAGCGVDAYFDNVFIGIGTAGGPDCGGTGDTSGGAEFVDTDGATFTVSSTQNNGGSFSGNLVADFGAGNGGPVDAVVKQANIGVGTVTPNTDYIVTFDLFGSLSGAGGVFFAEFFSELDGGGVSSAEILSGGPLTPTGTWTPYSFTVTTGSDVSGGITLQMKSSCGPIVGCAVDAYIDNVSIKLAN